MDDSAQQFDVRDHREKDWFWANNGIIEWYGEIIGADSIAVYMVLCKHANPAGECWPSYQTIADKLKLSRPTVIKCMKKLEATGLMAKAERWQPTKEGGTMPDSNMYILLTVKPFDAPSKARLLGLVKEIDHPTKKDDLAHQGAKKHSKPKNTPSKGDLPPLVNEVNPPSKRALPKQDSLNKTHETRGGDEKTEPPARTLSDLALAIADVCKINPKIPTDKQRRALNATYQALNGIGATVDEVRARETWWYANDWRAKKEGRAPRPDELQAI